MLAELFADGQERRVATIQNEFLKTYGFSAKTVTKAAKEVGLRARRDGHTGAWYWRMNLGRGSGVVTPGK